MGLRKTATTTTTKAVAIRGFQPTKADTERVKQLVLLGTPEEIIAQCIGANGISHNTLRDHFGDILSRYRNEMLGKIAASAYKMALDPKDGGDKNVPMNLRMSMKMFILKTRAGWKESDTTVINANQVQIIKRVIGVRDEDF